MNAPYTPDVEAVYRQTKEKFIAELPRISILQIIKNSVPYWIIFVAIPLFMISAPHTAYIWNQITPGVGWVAPIFVEFGLLYGSFRRRYANMKHETNPFFFSMLSVLLFVVAILSNGAGATIEVAKATQNANLSITEIVNTFGTLPIVSQVSLVMAVLSAFIVPIGAWASGESIGHLIFEYEQENESFHEQEWRKSHYEELRKALYTAYRNNGYDEATALKHSVRDTKGYLSTGMSNPSTMLSTVSNRVDILDKVVDNSGQKALPSPTKQEQAMAWFVQNPDAVHLSTDAGWEKIKSDGVDIGRSLFAKVKSNVKGK